MGVNGDAGGTADDDNGTFDDELIIVDVVDVVAVVAGGDDVTPNVNVDVDPIDDAIAADGVLITTATGPPDVGVEAVDIGNGTDIVDDVLVVRLANGVTEAAAADGGRRG
jgi:hypothetical protein